MKRLLYRIILFCVFFAILPADIIAQSFSVKRYTLEDGLKSNVIFDIDLDKSGKIWVAMENGVSSYDGKSWTAHIYHNRPPIIEYNHIAVDEIDQIWAMPKTLSYNMKMYNGHRWYSINVNPFEEFPNLNVESFNVQTKAGSTRVLIGTIKGLLIWEKNKTRLLTKKDGLIGNHIY
jgi:ligand-binding sensor domain-containing protein